MSLPLPQLAQPQHLGQVRQTADRFVDSGVGCREGDSHAVAPGLAVEIARGDDDAQLGARLNDVPACRHLYHAAAIVIRTSHTAGSIGAGIASHTANRVTSRAAANRVTIHGAASRAARPFCRGPNVKPGHRQRVIDQARGVEHCQELLAPARVDCPLLSHMRVVAPGDFYGEAGRDRVRA